MRVIEGQLHGSGRAFAIVAARVNLTITRALVDGASDCLRRHGVADDDLLLAWVPGSFELPLVAGRLAQRSRLAGVIAVGAVIQGSTDHHLHIAASAAAGLERAAAAASKPITFGVVTAATVEQAQERAGLKKNLGWDAALAALEATDLLARLDADADAGTGAGSRKP